MAISRIYDQSILDDDADVLVIPVTCNAKTPGGEVKAFGERYPGLVSTYLELSRKGVIARGRIVVIPANQVQDDGRRIALAGVRKDLDDSPPLYEIRRIAKYLRQFMQVSGKKSIAFYKMACRAGELKWDAVRIAIEQQMRLVPDVDVRLYEQEWV